MCVCVCVFVYVFVSTNLCTRACLEFCCILVHANLSFIHPIIKAVQATAAQLAGAVKYTERNSAEE